MINGNRGTFGKQLEKRFKTRKCPKCKRVFPESDRIKCLYCGCKLKSVKTIMWD